MKKFLLSNIVFGTISTIILAYTIYGILYIEESSVTSIIITIVYVIYLFAYVKRDTKK